MYIYRGKLDFSPNDSQDATNEGITIIFPSEFRLGDPIYTCWQWSTLGKMTNVPCWLTSIIDSVDNSDTDVNKIGFYSGDYRFDGFLSGSKGIEELSLMVRSGNIVGTAINTKLVFGPDSGPTVDLGVMVPRIYLGKFANYAPHSIDQLLLVIIPGTVGEGNPICAFWQWTESDGSTKVNVDFTSYKMTNVEKVADSVSFRFANDYLNFHATVSSKETAEQQHLTLAMTTPSNHSTGSMMLELRDLRPSPSRHQDGITAQFESKLRVARLESQIRIAQLESQLRIARLESQLRAAQDDNKLLDANLLETERPCTKKRLTSQERMTRLGI